MGAEARKKEQEQQLEGFEIKYLSNLENPAYMENLKRYGQQRFLYFHMLWNLLADSLLNSIIPLLEHDFEIIESAKFQKEILYVARNSRGVLVSLYHFKNNIASYPLYPSFEYFFEEFLQGNVLYGSWFDHIKGWLPMRNLEKFLFLSYEELHQNLKVSVEKICQFLGNELSEEEINSVMKNASFQVMKKHILENKAPVPIKNMESAKIMLMRKGICGDWKNHCTVTQMETFNKQYQEKMKGMDQDLFPWDQC